MPQPSDYLQAWIKYTEGTDSIPWLKEHRDWVEENDHGCCDRPHTYMWYQLLKDLPKKATLCEIGVFKGQMVSLWALIAKQLDKKFDIYGVTPMSDHGDHYGSYAPIDYWEAIKTIHDRFEVSMPKIIRGVSTDEWTWNLLPPLDVLYIDGSHDEGVVRNDVEKFASRVKKGGLVIFDDASLNVDMEMNPQAGLWFKGLDDPSRVADGFAETHEEILTVGHNRVFRV